MEKTIIVIFSKDAELTYQSLLNKQNSKKELMLLKAINSKIEILKENSHYGDPIKKGLIPKKYIENYGTTNLFRIELPLFWRMIYTLKSENEVEIIGFVLEILDHKDYDKLFGYRKN